MQFNNKITLRVTTGYDDYGVPSSYTMYTIKCAILSESKLNKTDEKKKRNDYDMVIIISAKSYAPYSQIFENETLEVINDSRYYDPKQIKQINNFSGKAKYYEIVLKQIIKGDEDAN